jgi:3-hydroxybutyrate dehydrogenase
VLLFGWHPRGHQKSPTTRFYASGLGWVLTPLVPKQVDAKAAAQNISNDDAKRQLLGEKEPSMQFTTPEELDELALFFCSAAGNNVRGVAWNMDGGWVAQ